MAAWSLLNICELLNWVSGALTFQDRILHLLMPGIFRVKLLKAFLGSLIWLSIMLLELPHLLSKLVIPPIHCLLNILFIYFIFLHSTYHHLPWFIFAFACHPWLECSLLSLVYCLVSSKENAAWHKGDAQYRYEDSWQVHWCLHLGHLKSLNLSEGLLLHPTLTAWDSETSQGHQEPGSCNTKAELF